MVAFVLPITWFLTGSVALLQLGRLSSTVSSAGLGLTNWKLRLSTELGLKPKLVSKLMVNPIRDFFFTLLKIEIPQESGENVYIFDIEKESVPNHPWLVQRYCLIGTEYENFLDGIRHLSLLEGVGPEADRVRELLKDSGRDYEELSFVWEGFGCDFQRLQELSNVRLKSSFLKVVGVVPEAL